MSPGLRRIHPHADKTRKADAPSASSESGPHAWEKEREKLLEMLLQQQRAAQAGLVTSALSHDIVNHVTIISGLSSLALQTSDPEAWRTTLERVQTQCRSLTETLQAFLGFVKRRTSADDETFRLSAIVDQANRLAKPLAKQLGLTVTPRVEDDGEVRGEARLAIQAVVNLVSNALRACAETSAGVWVTASCPSRNCCRLEVRDTGPGIPEDMRKRIFRPFATDHGDSGGNGLGLFIVRQSVRRMNGTIKVMTSPAGTTFQIDLPPR